MRRLIALLILLLPLQGAFAAAAAYCKHECEPASAVHFGHHFHAHQAADQGSDDGPQLDPDCGFCHLSFSQVTSAPLVLARAEPPTAAGPPPPSDFTSAPLPTPYRPPLRVPA